MEQRCSIKRTAIARSGASRDWKCQSFDVIIVGAGAAGCVLANRLSARSARRGAAPRGGPRRGAAGRRTGRRARFLSALLLQRRLFLARSQGALAAQGQFAADRLFPRPAGRRRLERSWAWSPIAARPTITPNGRLMAPPAGAGTTCCPTTASSRTIGISTARSHGKDGPVPIRRTKVGGLGAVVEGGRRFRARTADPVRRRHERGFSRRLRRGADEQLAGQARLGGDLLSRRRRPRAATICTVACRSDRDRPSYSKDGALPAYRRDVGGETQEFRGREIIVALGGIHSPAFLMRAGIGPASALRALGIDVTADLPGVGAKSLQSRHYLYRPSAKAGHAAIGKNPAAPDDGFRYSSGLPGAPPPGHVHQCPVQDVVEPARRIRSPISRPRCSSRCARGRVSLVSAQIRRPIRSSSSISPGTSSTCSRFMHGFRRCVEILGHPAVRAMARLTFPVKFNDRLRRLNRITTGQQDQKRGDRRPHRCRAAARRADLRHARRPPRRSCGAGPGRRRARRLTFRKTSPAPSIRSAPAAWARRTIATR